MKKTLMAFLLFPVASFACEVQWDYGDAAWIDGFRVYQDGAQVGTAAPTDRSGECAALGLTPGPGPLTMTAYRGGDESPKSDPAIFELIAPGVRVTVSIP